MDSALATPNEGTSRHRIRDERGAVGTEMAIVVAIVVAIAVALGVVMGNSAENHQDCIPENPGDAVPANCIPG
ncbi:MAG: hypothetical protein AAF547_07885 [Actinomycetota bacterium]